MKRQARGSVYRTKDGRWVAAVSAGKDAAGKRVRLVKYAATRKQAEEYLRALVAGRRRVQTIVANDSLEVFLRRWLEQGIKPAVRPTTYDSCRSALETHVLNRFGQTQLRKINPKTLKEFFNRLARRKGLSPISRLNVYKTLHWAFADGVRWGLFASNPLDGVKPPKVARIQIRILDDEETARFLKTAEQSRLYALYVMALLTGMRLGELLALKWEDIDWRHRRLSVRRSLVEIRGRLSYGALKTHPSRRTIELSPFCLAVLRGHRERMRGEGLSSPFIFVNTRGGHFYRCNLHRTSFKPLLQRAGLPPIPFHFLRHSHASHLLREGVHPKIVADRLGHKNASTVVNRYSHMTPGLQTAAKTTLNRVFCEC